MSFIAFLGINSPHNWAYKGPKKDDTPLYKQFTLIMAESLHMQHPNEAVHFYAVNFPEDFKQQLLQLNPSIIFTERKEDFSAYSQQHYKGWLMATKGAHILKTLQEQQKPLIYFDVDVLIRKKITRIQNMIENKAEITCLYRPYMPKDKHYATGLVGFGHNDNVLAFVQEWQQLMESQITNFMRPRSKGRSVSGDQLLLKQCLEKRKMKFKALPLSLNDGFLNKESEVWHGHKESKWKNLEIFQKELKRLKLEA